MARLVGGWRVSRSLFSRRLFRFLTPRSPLRRGSALGPCSPLLLIHCLSPSSFLQTLKSPRDWNFPLTRLFAEKVVVYFPLLYHWVWNLHLISKVRVWVDFRYLNTRFHTRPPLSPSWSFLPQTFRLPDQQPPRSPHMKQCMQLPGDRRWRHTQDLCAMLAGGCKSRLCLAPTHTHTHACTSLPGCRGGQERKFYKITLSQ